MFIVTFAQTLCSLLLLLTALFVFCVRICNASDVCTGLKSVGHVPVDVLARKAEKMEVSSLHLSCSGADDARRFGARRSVMCMCCSA